MVTSDSVETIFIAYETSDSLAYVRAKEIERILQSYGYIVRMIEPNSKSREISNNVLNASLIIVLGTASFGSGKNNRNTLDTRIFDTIDDKQLPYFEIKMCNTYDDDGVRFHFNRADVQWNINNVISTGIGEKINSHMNMLRNRNTSSSTMTTTISTTTIRNPPIPPAASTLTNHAMEVMDDTPFTVIAVDNSPTTKNSTTSNMLPNALMLTTSMTTSTSSSSANVNPTLESIDYTNLKLGSILQNYHPNHEENLRRIIAGMQNTLDKCILNQEILPNEKETLIENIALVMDFVDHKASSLSRETLSAIIELLTSVLHLRPYDIESLNASRELFCKLLSTEYTTINNSNNSSSSSSSNPEQFSIPNILTILQDPSVSDDLFKLGFAIIASTLMGRSTTDRINAISIFDLMKSCLRNPSIYALGMCIIQAPNLFTPSRENILCLAKALELDYTDQNKVQLIKQYCFVLLGKAASRNIDTITSHGIIPSVIMAMKDYTNEVIQENGCMVLSNCNNNSLGTHTNMYLILLNAMKIMSSNNHAAITAATVALAKFASNTNLTDSEVDIMVDVMRRNMDRLDVQHNMAEAISKFAHNNTTNQQPFRNKGILELLIQSIEKPSATDLLLQNTIAALVNICNNEQYGQFLVEKNIINIIKNVIRTSKNALTIAQCCKLLQLITSFTNIYQHFNVKDLLAFIVNNYHHQKFDDNRMECCRILFNILNIQNIEYNKFAYEIKAIEVIMNVLVQNVDKDHIGFQQAGFRTLRTIANTDERIQKLFGEAKWFPVFIKSMKTFIDNLLLHELLEDLSCLLTYRFRTGTDTLKHEHIPTVTGICFTLLENFPNNPLIVENCLYILWQMIKMSASVVKSVTKTADISVIEFASSTYITHENIQKYCTDLLDVLRPTIFSGKHAREIDEIEFEDEHHYYYNTSTNINDNSTKHHDNRRVRGRKVTVGDDSDESSRSSTNSITQNNSNIATTVNHTKDSNDNTTKATTKNNTTSTANFSAINAKSLKHSTSKNEQPTIPNNPSNIRSTGNHNTNINSNNSQQTNTTNMMSNNFPNTTLSTTNTLSTYNNLSNRSTIAPLLPTPIPNNTSGINFPVIYTTIPHASTNNTITNTVNNNNPNLNHQMILSTTNQQQPYVVVGSQNNSTGTRNNAQRHTTNIPTAIAFPLFPTIHPSNLHLQNNSNTLTTLQSIPVNTSMNIVTNTANNNNNMNNSNTNSNNNNTDNKNNTNNN